MAPHSSTLAWKILWTEEPGRLQSMVRQTQRSPEGPRHLHTLTAFLRPPKVPRYAGVLRGGGAAAQLGSPEPLPPHYEPGAEQWVELVGFLPPHLLLPQQKVVLEPLPGLPARASPDQRVRIQRVPQVLVFGTAATLESLQGRRDLT